MRLTIFSPLALLLAGALFSGCGSSTDRLSGKIAFVSNQFEYTGEPGSNYGIFVWEKGKVRPFYQGGGEPHWDTKGGKLFCRKNGRIEILEYPSGKALGTVPINGYCIHFAFFEDGRRLVYVGWNQPVEGKDLRDLPPTNLFLRDLETGVEEQLTFVTDRRADIGTMDISRDGKIVAFQKGGLEDRDDDGSTRTHVYLLDLKSREIVDVGRGYHPRFFLTEDAIVYSTAEINGEHLLAGPAKEDGQSLRTIDLVRYDLKTKQKVRLTNNERFAHERTTSFSPDGQHFVSAVFIWWAGERGRAIRLFKSDGTQLRTLVGEDGYDYQDPDWAP